MLITRCKDTYFFPNCKKIHDFFQIPSRERMSKNNTKPPPPQEQQSENFKLHLPPHSVPGFYLCTQESELVQV